MNDYKIHYKVLYLAISCLLFSIIYSFIDTTQFHGLNKIQDKIKDDIVEDEVKDELESKDSLLEGFYEIQNEKEDIKKEIKKVVKEEEDKIENPSFYQRYLDSLYFSIITSCLLGYGDIYPVRNLSKFLVSIQCLITISLILY